jgi:hypothetical protein
MDMTVMFVAMSPFLMVAAIVFFSINGATQKRKAILNTVEEAIRAGQDMTPEKIAALGMPPKDSNRDLKSGSILLAVAAALIVFGWMVSGMDHDAEEAQMVFGGIAAFPGFIGLVLVAFGLMSKKNKTEESA